MGFFTDRTAIVTGAASGIGRAVSAELLVEGARVALADVNEELLKQTAEELSAAGGTVKVVTLDVTDREAVQKAVDDTVDEWGRLDYMFNNAGIGVLGEARYYEYDDWKRVIDVDLWGVIHGVIAAYPKMIEQGSGHIVNTASLAGIVAGGFTISYTASKHAVVGLSNTLRVEAAAYGVKVSVVCPGVIETPIVQTTKLLNIDREKLLDNFPESLPPDKCARAILRGVRRNQSIIVITATAKIFWALQRLSPRLTELAARTYGMKPFIKARLEDK